MSRSHQSEELAVRFIRVSDNELTQRNIIAVIPGYNAEREIGTVVLTTRQHVERVIVVDDGSSDRTAEVARSAGAEVIRLDESTGKAYALLLGLRRAREYKCTVAVTLDARGRNNPREIERLAGHIISGNKDLVIGSHYLNRQDPPLSFEKFDQLFLKSGGLVTDSGSSFMAFSMDALEYLDFRTAGFRMNRDLITFFDTKSLRISEVPITLRQFEPEDLSWGYPVKVLAGMPAFNEEKYIAKTITGARTYVDQVLVIDDGSTDATFAIARDLGAIVVRHPKNCGYGAAIKTIFEKAREMHVDALVIIDSDGQHDPKDIESLISRLRPGDIDIVIGSRFARGTKKEIPKYRIIGMMVLDRFTQLAGADSNSDSQSGFRAYNKKAIDAIRIHGAGMSVGSEILIQAAYNNLKIAEMPIEVRYDVDEPSSQNPVSHGISVIYSIVGMIGYRHPLAAFGIPGFILVITGFIVGSSAFSEYYSTLKFPFMLSMVSAMFLIMGLLFIIGGLILNYLVVFVKEQKSNVP
jgi:glycosyltransferase involved in cell wall biosynthesis